MSDSKKTEKAPAAGAQTPKAEKPRAEKPKAARRGLPTAAWAAIVVVALAAGAAGGYVVSNMTGGVALEGQTTLSDGQLDSAIATYTYDGQTHDITAREIITQNSTVESAANDDGTYDVPAASDVLSYAQNQVLLDEAAARGITVSDDEVASFTEDMFGSSDYASIASSYGIDEDIARSTLTDSALISKLRDSVVSTTVPDKPTAPTAPADGAEDTPTADYASYVIALLGDEWDSDAGTWARTDGQYYATLSSYEITNDSATYAAAQAAYQVAESAYESAASTVSSEWTDFARGVLANATVQIGSLVAS